jgi:hypothetical protein
MDTEINGAQLAECMSLLDEDAQRAVRRYWEQVIREEWVPQVRRRPRAVPLAEDRRRERREARRAVGRIAAASRVAPVVAHPPLGRDPGVAA